MGIRLQNRRPGAPHLSSFAAKIAFGTNAIKTTVRGRKLVCLGKRPLSCGLLGSIDINEEPLISQTIPQPTWWRTEWGSCHQILLKKQPKGFNTWLIKSRKKTAERGMTGKGATTKEGHEGGGKRPKALIKCFQREFPTHCIANEHDEKVNRVVVTKPGANKPHPLLDGIQNAKLSQHMSHNGYLTKPRGHRGNRRRRNLDFHGRMHHTGSVSSLLGYICFSFF